METMAVTERIPADWRGSDLRSRREVVQYLADRGGVLEDKTGLVVGHMREELKRGRALAQLLADMEQDGMISREVRGRRTFRVELLDDWGLTEDRPAISLVQDAYDEPAGSEPDDGDGLDLRGVDLTALAETLLGVVVNRMTADRPAEGGPTNRELSERLRRADREIATLTADLREARESLTKSKDEVAELKRQAAAAQQNVEVLRAELNKASSRKKATAGAPIGEQIGEEGRKALERLMKALPETPASKPRRQAK